MNSPHVYYVPEEFSKYFNMTSFHLLMSILKSHYKDARLRPSVSITDSLGVYRDMDYNVLKDPENGVNISF
jgi:hypothetical protein